MPELVATAESNGGQEQPAADKSEDAPASKAVVGIIYPPPEVRNIVDKTADFVARNGPEFESRIKLNEAGNNKFNFLNTHDPYHAYYQHKIKEIQEGVAQEKAAAQQPGYVAPKLVQPVAMTIEPSVPKEPPSEYEFMAEPPSISGLDLDIVKLTAQFVARNGAQFVDKLMMKEQRNYHFDFLRKQHPLFNYFTKMVEQYTKVINPQRETIAKFKRDLENPFGMLDRARHRVEWHRFQEKQKRQMEEKQEKERVEYAQIDWHDFVLVETIDFKESEMGYLPPPIRPTQLAQRLLQQTKYERLAVETGDVQEIEMEVEEQEPDTRMETRPQSPKRAPSPPRPAHKARPLIAPSAPPTGPVEIRRDYNPKSGGPAKPAPEKTATPGQFLISPITGEKIPAHKMEEHMRFSLLDPRWVEEKKKQVDDKRAQKEVFEGGMSIGSNLRLLAERRTDIFGKEETVIGQKIGEKPVKAGPGVQWDGHSGSVETTRKKAKENISDQIEAIRKANEAIERAKQGPTAPGHSLPSVISQMPRPPSSAPPARPILSSPLPPQQQHPLLPMHMQPPMGGMLPPRVPGLMPLPNSAPPIVPLPSMADLAPPFNKRPRNEADEFVSEHEFIANNPGPVSFQVQVPNISERAEWKLSGQVISVTLPITDSVSVIKAKLAEELGMPTGKQKLQIGGTFLKDSNSLGFYNMAPSTMVTLGLKERGGRKK